MGTTHFRSLVNFAKPNRSAANVPLYAGLPLAIQLRSQFYIHENNFQRSTDLMANGTNWTVTGTVTPALSDDVFPSYARLTDGAGTDNAVVSSQWTDTSGAGEYLLISGRQVYFETAIRLGDANGNAASVTQTEFFAGFAITDATTIAGATDFIGFLKRDVTDDSSNLIRFVAGKNASTTGALVDGITLSTGIDLAAAGDAATVGGAEGGTIARLAFLYDGAQNLAYVWAGEDTYPAMPNFNYIGVVGAGSADPINFPDDEQLCLTYELKNGEAVAKTLDIFHYLVAIER